jgi:hypothetical protein
MTSQNHNETEAWRYAKEAMSWYGWGAPIGLSLGFSTFIVGIGAFLVLLHVAGVIR